MTQPNNSTNHYWLDYDSIQQLPVGKPGPSGFMELVPGTGTWVPDPATNQLRPGFFPPNVMPKYPVDLSTMQQYAPKALGPAGGIEIPPGSGTWFANPKGTMSSPTMGDYHAKMPFDLGAIKRLPPDALGPARGYTELVPHSGIWVPDPKYNPNQPSAYHHDNDDPNATPATGGGKGVLDLDYNQLEKLAKDHDLNADQIRKWANEHPGFAEEYLQTHGKVNYGTYLKIKEFMTGKQLAGNAFAELNSTTAGALRTTIAAVSDVDAGRAAAFKANGASL